MSSDKTHKAIFTIQKENGNITDTHKAILREQFGRELADGEYRITIEEGKAKRYNATRYKYYFDCLLSLALPHVAKKFLIVNTDGEVRHPITTAELHECYKLMYNSVQVVIPEIGKSYQTAATTTGLSDSEFIGQYQEQIIESLISPPLCLEIPTIDEWRGMREEGTWREFKTIATAN